jgi:thioesterase domain-containing protein
MSTTEDLREIEEFFHQQIPLTRAMALHVEAYDGVQLVLTAPIEVNHNHLGTAFGGSLAAMGMVAGYGLVWLMLGKREGHVVVRDASINFRRPVRGLIRAVCRRPNEAAVADFLSKFANERNAHLRLEVTIQHDGRDAVQFEGTFVATK